jgi:hypothetical protein
VPKVNKQTAETKDYGPVVDCQGVVDGYTVGFTSFKVDIDGTPLLKGAVDDRCQCPHWGYVLKGGMTFRFPDHDLVLEEGDAFYVPPGHIPIQEADSEILMFSPSEELQVTSDVIMKNMQQMQGASS